MFVFSFKASTLKYVGVMSLCALAIVLTVAIMPSNDLGMAIDGTVVEVSAERKAGDFKNIKSQGDRISFLSDCGWQADAESERKTEVTIPEEFDEIYSEYGEMQKKEGLDLEKYKGKRVTMYTYSVTDGESNAVATLLIYKNNIIGGDISSADPGGFCYGLGGK